VRALIVSPDYASHYFPLSALGQALADRGHEVAVATGPSLAGRVRGDGFEHHELALGPASNPGLLRTAEQPAREAARLQAFLDATRDGMVATLRVQAEARLHDLLWRPKAVTRRLGEILAETSPAVVVSDQLAFGATLALRALGQPYVSFHPGHPSALPGSGELFGFPTRRPAELAADADELAKLWSLCAEVSARFTRTFNATLRDLNSRAEPVGSALSATSPLLTLLNYPAELGGYRRPLLPHTARFIGASVRRDPAPQGVPGADGSVPQVYVSLGSFLSARSDVLRRIVAAFKGQPVRLIVAAGVTPPAELGDLPEEWHVASYLPQPEVLRSCDLAICHGGNNTVTEALWAGVPLLVAPFSTDQFAGAEDVRRAGVGDVFDPNRASAAEIAARAVRLLAGDALRRASALGARLRETAGPPLASRLVERAALSLRSAAPPTSGEAA
jgi:MGT family glycosyltransferase